MAAALRGADDPPVEGQARNAVAVGAAACAFGVISVLAKLAYRAGASPPALLSTRLVVAALVLAVAAPLLRAHPTLEGAACGCGFGIGGFLEFEALHRLPAPAAAVLMFLAPVWVAAWSALVLRRRLRPLHAAMIAAALAGMVMLVGFPPSGTLDPAGVVLACTASVLFAATFLVCERLVARVGVAAPVVSLLAGAAATALVVEPGGPAAALGDGGTAPYAAAIGALTAGSLLLLAAGLRTSTALAASVATGAEPVVVAALSWPLLGERLSAVQLLGAAVVVAAATCVAAGGASGRAVAPTGARAPGSARRRSRAGTATRPRSPPA